MIGVIIGVGAAKLAQNAIEDDKAEQARRAEAERAAEDQAGVDRGREQLAEPHGYRSSDELLDAGAAGLRFFAVFGPLYTDWTGDEFDIVTEVYRPHDRVREIDFGAFRADAYRLTDARRVGAATAEAAWGSLVRLRESWRGSAADAARDRISWFRDVSLGVANSAGDLGTTTSAVIDGVETQIREFALGVLDLYEPTCAGRGPGEIQQLIDLAKGRGLEGLLNKLQDWRMTPADLLEQSIVSKAIPIPTSWLGPFAEIQGHPVPPIWVLEKLDEQFGVQEMQRQATDWLNDHFVRAFTGKMTDLLTLCDVVRTGVDETLGRLDSAFTSIKADAFDGLLGGPR